MNPAANHEKLRALIDRAGITQREAAEIINREAGEAITLRTLQRWLADPSATLTASHCPGWAARLLDIGLGKRKKPAPGRRRKG